ncbi:hypothetical protein [Dethiobacter alkaliphilus]|uniref:Uncharacterized protein n=1 Tax=Dethiobacter alkaliphilus AHT 1 TaxID=555088 RepID=C0GD14_DETAL|nr:hypothetical protein [Dethiobacter alkaliphilus]EEG79099.1 conserved hypothetical protein [Dethiobacter alkaliphilus AHT 1]
MYATFYNNLFWGFFLAFFDLRISGISITPDFVGFIIIYNALDKLAQQHDNYNKAKPFALILIFLSLPNTFELHNQNLLTNPIANQNLFLILLSQIQMIMSILLIYYICGAVSALANSNGLAHLHNESHNLWLVFLATSAAILLTTPFTLTILLGNNTPLIILYIILLLVHIAFLFFLRHAQRQLGESLYPGI